MDVDHILVDRGFGVCQDLACELSPVSHQQFVEEEVHLLHVAGIPHGFVVEVLDRAVICLTHRAEPTRGGKRFEPSPGDVDGLVPLHGRDPFTLAVFNDLTVIQVLVNHTLR